MVLFLICLGFLVWFLFWQCIYESACFLFRCRPRQNPSPGNVWNVTFWREYDFHPLNRITCVINTLISQSVGVKWTWPGDYPNKPCRDHMLEFVRANYHSCFVHRGPVAFSLLNHAFLCCQRTVSVVIRNTSMGSDCSGIGKWNRKSSGANCSGHSVNNPIGRQFMSGQFWRT